MSFNTKLKRPLNVRITKNDLIDLKALYQAHFQSYPIPTGGQPELWYNIVLEFLQRKGWDVCNPEVQQLEDRIREYELQDKYVEALMATFSGVEEVTDNEKIFELIIMGSELRRDIALETLGILETR